MATDDDASIFEPAPRILAPSSPLPRNAVPIPTMYEGVLYRSRLEARWAVFLATLGVRALYEQEAFELGDGTRYLPDFWLPAIETFVEIKPGSASNAEQEKCALLAVGTGRHVVLAMGAPGDWLGYAWTRSGCAHEFGVRYWPDGREDTHYLLCECPGCGRFDWCYEGRAARIECACDKSSLPGKEGRDESPRIVQAAARANAVNLGVR